MKSLFQIKKEIMNEREKYFKNYTTYCRSIKEKAKEFIGDSEVIVFGSIVGGNYSPGSDIDVLIISDNLPEPYEERIKIAVAIKSQLGHLNPFQLHLVKEKEFEKYYKPFIKNDYVKI